MVTQRTQGLYRVFLLCQIILVAALFWFGVWVMVGFLARGIFTGSREEKTLLVGSTSKAAQLRGWLKRKSEIGLRIIGIICDEPLDCTEDGIPVLGGSEKVENIIRERGITQVILLE